MLKDFARRLWCRLFWPKEQELDDRIRSRDSFAARHELTDANIRLIVAFWISLVLLGVVLRFAFAWAIELYSSRKEVKFLAHASPPAPILQVSPPTDLQILRERDRRILNSYAWLDPKQGIARIPIERAMELSVTP